MKKIYVGSICICRKDYYIRRWMGN